MTEYNEYKNPIAEPQMVTIPKGEYTGLVRGGMLLESIEKVLRNVEEYRALDVIKLLLDVETDRKGAE